LRLKRSHYEIVYDILRYCMRPRRISNIAQYCNLNTVNAKRYLGELLRRGFVREVAGGYVTSEKGLEYVRAFEELYRLLSA